MKYSGHIIDYDDESDILVIPDALLRQLGWNQEDEFLIAFDTDKPFLAIRRVEPEEPGSAPSSESEE